MITINGQFTARRLTGQERFAVELVTEIDKICQKGDYELVVPKNAKFVPKLSNISVIRYGKAKGSLWEQLYFAYYVIVKGRKSLNLCSIQPIFKPGIICIHDLAFKTNKQTSFWNLTFYKKVSKVWHILQYHIAKHFSPLVLTVSEYSKNEMVKVYHYNPSKVLVIGNGWDHFKRIAFDEQLKIKHPEYFERPYFFSLASLTPNKNFKWILKVAQKHPQYQFLIGGNANIRAYGTDFQDDSIKNVKFLGYISDGEVKTLMKYCRAFIFPSFFEGFGIPPLEALSVGASIIISNTTCLPEIFGKTAHYIDPYNADVNLDEILSEPTVSPQKVLEKYTFARFAKILHQKLCSKN
nr:glycosyltransferase family 1 protein [Prevotella sp.]